MSQNPKDSLLGKIAAYTEILSTDPRSTIFVSLSEAYRKMGMLDDAYAVAVKGLDHLPDYCPGHVVLARIKCQQGDLDGSEAAFRKALEIDSGSLAALVGFSRLYLLQDRKLDARKILLKARDLSPADPVINKLLLSLPEEAVEVIAPAPQVEPAQKPAAEEPEPAPPEPLESATLAELYLKQGMATKAIDIYRNLLARDPDNLQLRRRIRDLEAKMAGAGSLSSVDVESEPVPATRPEAAASGAPKAQDTAPVEPPSVVDQLNRLLISIQKRRGDV